MDSATLLVRQIFGDDAQRALSLEALYCPPAVSGGEGDTRRSVYALVELAASDADPIGAAVARSGPGGTACLSLFVTPPHRHQGLGTRMLEDVLDLLRSQGWARAQVDVGENPVAFRLCARSGFKPLAGEPGRLVLDL